MHYYYTPRRIFAKGRAEDTHRVKDSRQWEGCPAFGLVFCLVFEIVRAIVAVFPKSPCLLVTVLLLLLAADPRLLPLNDRQDKREKKRGRYAVLFSMFLAE